MEYMTVSMCTILYEFCFKQDTCIIYNFQFCAPVHGRFPGFGFLNVDHEQIQSKQDEFHGKQYTIFDSLWCQPWLYDYSERALSLLVCQSLPFSSGCKLCPMFLETKKKRKKKKENLCKNIGDYDLY